MYEMKRKSAPTVVRARFYLPQQENLGLVGLVQMKFFMKDGRYNAFLLYLIILGLYRIFKSFSYLNSFTLIP